MGGRVSVEVGGAARGARAEQSRSWEEQGAAGFYVGGGPC